MYIKSVSLDQLQKSNVHACMRSITFRYLCVCTSCYDSSLILHVMYLYFFHALKKMTGAGSHAHKALCFCGLLK